LGICFCPGAFAVNVNSPNEIWVERYFVGDRQN